MRGHRAVAVDGRGGSVAVLRRAGQLVPHHAEERQHPRRTLQRARMEPGTLFNKRQFRSELLISSPFGGNLGLGCVSNVATKTE